MMLWGRHTWSVLKSPWTELDTGKETVDAVSLPESVDFYSSDIHETAIHWWHWGIDCPHSLFRSPSSEISSSRWSSTQKIVLKWPFIDYTREDISHIHYLCLPGHMAASVSWILPGRWSWIGHSLVTLGKRLCKFTFQISKDRYICK